jgi:hypothetical protein
MPIGVTAHAGISAGFASENFKGIKSFSRDSPTGTKNIESAKNIYSQLGGDCFAPASMVGVAIFVALRSALARVSGGINGTVKPT